MGIDGRTRIGKKHLEKYEPVLPRFFRHIIVGGFGLAGILLVGLIIDSAFDKLDPSARIEAFRNGYNYEQYKSLVEDYGKLKSSLEQEYKDKSSRLSVEEFFRRYDINRDGVIDSLEYKMSLPVQEK